MIIVLQSLVFFRKPLLAILDGLLRPYYKRFFSFHRQSVSDDEESEDQVFSEFDEEKGVVFYPPMYSQRYAAVTDCLMDQRWCGQLEKVVDLGYHDVSFIKYLKEIPGVNRILGVDLEIIPLRCSSDLVIEYTPKRENPLQVTLFQGNASDPDYRLIGCDAVVAIEVIEHMLPHDLDRLVHTVFGFIKPWVAIFTTPNGDFNPLFKALEKNGLRRLDHFFEWSREQFHDWCSNIVLRYPQYTVVCKGIGPGPAGTFQYGCCSQLALFVAKDYSKQQDLDLNSLALVANTKDRNNLSEIIGSVESFCDDTEQHMLCLPNTNEDSATDFISARSISTLMPEALTILPLEYKDRSCQCNLDTEVGKSFLMFEDESCLNVMVPRKKIVNRVYDMEDVANRLNCSNFQVKKFSKTTQNLMAKNKMDSLVHTREVVDEIRHLTKMLNFNNGASQKGDGLWCNFNWGGNAPYWNQYYKVVREYSYPFEVKSEESRIIDLIFEEINRTIDSQYDEELAGNVSKIEIPMSYLMQVVQHITEDVDRVKDLLEWNGYEIIDDVLVYTRLVAQTASVTTREESWDNDSLTDFDVETSDVHSTTLSDGSTISPDFTGRCLQRALDRKVRKLRSMLTADEDITAELDRVVCRLMKLALRTSRVYQHPPPTRWMQCKLFDLLSLTEKAIDRRRKRFIENFQLNALESEERVRSVDETLAIKIENDDSVNMLVDKYKYLVQSYENKDTVKKARNSYSNFGGFDFDEHLSDSSNEFIKEFEFVNEVESKPSTVYVEPTPANKFCELDYSGNKETSKLQRIQAWVDEDVDVVPYPDHDVRLISSGDTDQSTTNIRNKLKKISRKHKVILSARIDKTDTKIQKKSQPKGTVEKYSKTKRQENKKASKGKLFKKITGKKSSYCLLVKANMYKTSSTSYANLRSKKMRDYLNSVKPIPVAIRELCHPDLKVKKKIKDNMEYLINIDKINNMNAIENKIEIKEDVSATEESLLVNIVTDDKEETIALRRTLGTDAEEDPAEIEQETVLGSLLNVMRNDSFCNKPGFNTENVHSQTIFLNDIYEPSTSKGVRHVSMDVQCGPDVTTTTFSTLSATTSFTKIPKMFNNGIKIGNSESELPARHSDYGTCTGEFDCQCKTISPRTKSVGIIIKDSETETNFKRNNTECCTMTNDDVNGNQLVKAAEFVKPISSGMKIEDSESEYFGSIGSVPKSSMCFDCSPALISETVLKTCSHEDLGPKYAYLEYLKPKLSLGGMHVHSYKDKQESVDVMYQGKWQKSRPKAFTKKRVVFNTASVKKLTDMTKKLKVNSKEKLQIKSGKKKVKLEQTNLKPVQVRMHKCEPKLGEDTKIKKALAPTNNIKIKCTRNIPKVPNKLAVSPLTINKPKTGFVPKRPAGLMSTTTTNEPKHISKEKINTPEVTLKRKILKPVTKNILNKSIDTVKKVNDVTKVKHPSSLIRSKTEFIKKELLKFDDSPRDYVSYVVLRNESENKNNKSPKVNTRKNDSTNKRTLSPQSQNSSTCSSPNSIATVRVASNRSKLANNRRISSSSNPDNIDTDTVTPVRNKKFTKKNRSAKKAESNDLDNKENVPQSSNSIKKESDVNAKSAFIKSHKSASVFRAKVTTENVPLQNTLNSLSRHKTSTPIKSNLKLGSPSSVAKCSESPNMSSIHKIGNSHNTLSSQKSTTLSTPNSKSKFERTRSRSLTNEPTYSTEKNIALSFKRMIEERLDFIKPSLDDLSSIGSKTVILSRENLNSFNLNESDSPDSFRTVINNEDLDATLALHDDIENAVNRTFDLIADSTEIVDDNGASTDTDVLSFRTTAASRPSEYFLAENEIENFETSFSKIDSVRDIFERKDQLMAQSDGGNLASQAFSGFSINAVAGDRPDPISYLDSETGSLAMDIARQAASEEVLVSGRSSGSYESCLYDNDEMIPYWLFHINSQFEDEDEEEEEPEVLPIPVDLPEPVFDVNGNVVAAGAGAGDGRGMHSDQSQDSSGRGTSTTSSDPSSGAQSEAILIDPSAFTAQFELPAVAVSSEVPEVVLQEAGENIGEAAAPERNGRRNPVIQVLATSDMDADVSSLDTDVQDSS